MDFLKKPNSDFNATRDGRLSMPLYLDVDLTTARSITGTGANAALAINISGNSFYVDADTVNIGVATVHFQDTSLSSASAPFSVAAGFIASVPFTQILIENAAQPSKRLRVFYGVDIDFQAGVNASVAISGRVDLNDVIGACQFVQRSGVVNIGTLVTQLLAPASNINGILVRDVEVTVNSGATGGTTVMVMAALTAPMSLASKSSAVILGHIYSFNANTIHMDKSLNRRVPAGWGLFVVEISATVTGSDDLSVSFEVL